MPLNDNPTYVDEISNSYLAGTISVSTTAVEAKVGASRLVNRKFVRIYNNSTTTIYFGPTGVTATSGEPLFQSQWVEVGVEEGDIPVFMITASGTAADVRVQELS
jgi:hypothetical protein